MFLPESGPAGEGEIMESAVLEELCGVIAERVKNRPKGSYVAKLVEEGLPAIRAKITEESGELVEASEIKGRGEIVWEAADLLFHMIVLLEAHGIPFDEILQELKRRRK